MDSVWNIIKDYSTPIILRSMKFEDMSEEKMNEAMRDLIFRIIFLLLLPYTLSMLISFVLAVSTGMILNVVITKIIGSYESFTKLRQVSVLFSGSAVFGFCLLSFSSHIIPSIYTSIGDFLGIGLI
uniref:Polysacc_synt_C domain-containing protein n=1 Tax=Caenorhabditis tropicalis TaxID=1561998 RepID=A0A1I7TSD3_9PELO